MLTTTKLAVWGDPIGHSRSPQLHAAAYEALGLADWEYTRRRVSESDFGTTLEGLDASWRGLSLTMPLKRVAYAASDVLDTRAQLSGAVNTLLMRADGSRHGFNTDIGGIVAAIGELGIGPLERARILGSGATATSSLLALAELGVTDVSLVARRPEALDTLRVLGDRVGMRVHLGSFGDASIDDVQLTIATLPGDVVLEEEDTARLVSTGGALFDVAYGGWPTALGARWQQSGAPAASGLWMLLHQALLQVRVFVNGNPESPLVGELHVLADMRRAIMGE